MMFKIALLVAMFGVPMSMISMMVGRWMGKRAEEWADEVVSPSFILVSFMALLYLFIMMVF